MSEKDCKDVSFSHWHREQPSVRGMGAGNNNIDHAGNLVIVGVTADAGVSSSPQP